MTEARVKRSPTKAVPERDVFYPGSEDLDKVFMGHLYLDHMGDLPTF